MKAKAIVIANEIKDGTAYTVAGFRLFNKNGYLTIRNRKGECFLTLNELVEFIEYALKLNKAVMKCR